ARDPSASGARPRWPRSRGGWFVDQSRNAKAPEDDPGEGQVPSPAALHALMKPVLQVPNACFAAFLQALFAEPVSDLQAVLAVPKSDLQPASSVLQTFLHFAASAGWATASASAPTASKRTTVVPIIEPSLV